GCARSAAPLTPTSPRPRPPRRGTRRGHLQAREFRFSPCHSEQGRDPRKLSTLLPFPRPTQSSAPGLPTPLWALGEAAELPHFPDPSHQYCLP
ncbi:hypothetical protein P7K49_021995, partial [Saguinus oedipus]